MAKLKVFSIFDQKAGAFLSPFYMTTRGQAMRAFGDLATNPEHEVFKHAEDYTLFELCEFDQESGKFTVSEPQSVCLALHFKKDIG